MAGEPAVDGVVRAIQLARARAKYQGFMKGVTASLMDVRWLLEQTMKGSKNEGVLDREGDLLVERYLEMEAPYRLRQMKEYLTALGEAVRDVGEFPQALEKLEAERGRLLARVRNQRNENEETGAARGVPEELAGYAEQLDSMGKELDRQAHDFLLTFIQTNRVSKEVARSLLEGEEAT